MTERQLRAVNVGRVKYGWLDSCDVANGRYEPKVHNAAP